MWMRMTDEKTYKKIIHNKSAMLNILWHKLKDTESQSWDKTPQGTRQRTGDKIPIYELMMYGEAILFEFGSFLDIFMKYACGKNLHDKVYFNQSTLGKLKPQDEFSSSLNEYWSNGLSGNPVFSLEKMKEYRNAITHATMLDISKHMVWKKGDGFPKLEKNFYILPDNPKEDFDSYTYTERIPLFGFFEEIGKIFAKIENKMNEESLFNIYDYA